MVGRFVEKKGLLDGLRACAVARCKGAPVNLTIVGDAAMHDEVGKQLKAELYSAVAQSGLDSVVHFAGFLSSTELRRVMAEQDVFLCPSKHAANGDAEGGSPVALIEAMAMGLICIGTRHCDIPEVIHDGQTGFLCEPGDVRGMASALIKVMSDRESMPVIAEAGRAHVAKGFSLSTQLHKLSRLYDEIACRF
jgi:colanic acid/amylovoran biosynthesis glycosyltransferase